MKYLVTAEEMKEYDRNTSSLIGIEEAVLMERAAICVKERIEKVAAEKKQQVLILVGKGNNGADGLALARLLCEEEHCVEVCLSEVEGHASSLWEKQKKSLSFYKCSFSQTPNNTTYDVIVDALLGIGLTRPIQGHLYDLIEKANQLKGYKIAIDIPSGIDSDTGEVRGTAFRANETVTFGFAKRGLVLYPGVLFAGSLQVCGIGIGKEAFFSREPSLYYYDEKPEQLLPERISYGNKGSFGKVLLICGSENMAGAAILSARACYRMGAGMVKVISPAENRIVLQEALPECLYGDEKDLEAGIRWADVIAIGPGLSTNETAKKMLQHILLKSTQPLVIDADAINLCAKHPDLLQNMMETAKKRALILTPHVMELKRLMTALFQEEYTIDEIKGKLLFYAQKTVKRLHVIIVAKDAKTFICKDTGIPCINIFGNNGMAVAGSGDVLTGIIAALLAQGMEPFEAAAKGATLHAHAGDAAREKLGEHGVMPTDMITYLR